MDVYGYVYDMDVTIPISTLLLMVAVLGIVVAVPCVFMIPIT